MTGAVMNLGEIRKARELGYKGHCQYVWHACVLCGRQRWTELRQGRVRHTICSACANGETHRQTRQLVTKEHTCPPHHWLIDSEDVGRCKYCAEVKDFRGLRSQVKPEFPG